MTIIKERTAMVNLHRWLKKNSPHLVLAGSLAITGLSGCRNAQYTAVEVEPAPAAQPAPSTYPAPLMVPEASRQSVPTESDTASSEYEADGDLFLKPPVPPLAESGSNSGTGKPPQLPMPELDSLDETAANDLKKVETEPKQNPKATEKNTASTVAEYDPLDETNLFPEDNSETTGKNAVSDSLQSTKEVTVVVEDGAGKDTVVGQKTGSIATETSTDPFADIFESSVANPEVPVPNPKKDTVKVDGVDSDLTPVEPFEKVEPSPKEVREELKSSDAGTSNLFPPSDNEQALPEIQPEEKQGSDNGDAASLPSITPSVSAGEVEPEFPQGDQLASITKPATNSLFPTTERNRQAPPHDAISVVAEVWSPGDNVVFDDSGNAFVSHGKHISKVSTDGTVEPWATLSSPRGHVVLPGGNHLVADSGQRAIVELNWAGEQVRKVATKSNGDFLRAPNDLVVDSNGGVYFTDPGYARIRNSIGRIHYVAADGKVSVVAQRLAFPEGIALSADGSKLLVVESQAQRVIEFKILSPGKVGPKRVFAELPAGADDSFDGFANGLRVDAKTGRVFVAQGDRQQIDMLSAEGKLLRSFNLGAAVNGVAFKVHDNSRLFATGGARSGLENAGQLFEIRLTDRISAKN